MRHIIDKALERGAEVADLFALDTTTEQVSFQYSKLQSITSKKLFGYCLQAVQKGKVGKVASSSLERSDQVVSGSLEAAQYGDGLGYDLAPASPLPDISFSNDALWQTSQEKYLEDGKRAIDVITEYEPDATVGVRIIRQREQKYYGNSLGCDQSSQADRFRLNIGAELVHGKSLLEVESLYQGDDDHYNLDLLIAEVIEKLKMGRVETTLESGKMPVILTPGAVTQLAVILAVGLSGEQVRQGVSPLKGRLDEQVLSSLITLVDDALLKGGAESIVVDDEGTLAERTVLFDKGVLRNYLLNRKSAYALKMAPNGKGFRQSFMKPKDHATIPSPMYTNWIMEPGKTTLDDMIADVDQGLMIHDMTGLIMGNLLKGEIDSDIDLAFKIKNGKIVGRVKDAAIGSNLYTLFKDQVVALENKTHLASFIGGHMLMPHILLKDVNIVL